MAQFSWPAVLVSANNPAIGVNGSTSPLSAQLVGGSNPSGNLQPLNVDLSGNLAALPLPAGAATSARQDTGNTSLGSIDTKTPALVTGRVPVDGSGVTQPVSGAVSVSNFPATQAVAGSVSVSNFPATQTVAGAVTVSNFPTTQAISAASLPLPTGAATSAKQPALGTAGSPSADVLTVQGSATGTALPVSGTVAVSGITNPLPTGTNTIGFTKQGGRAQAFAPVYNAYATTTVLTSAYVQLVASTTTASTYLDVFDSSGQAMILATGGAGSEVPLAYVPPGGDQIAVTVAAGTRLSVKALTANATSGYLLLNGWN